MIDFIFFNNYVTKFNTVINNLNSSQVGFLAFIGTIFSVIITFIIFLFNKNKELKLKQYENKKEAYKEFINLIVKITEDLKYNKKINFEKDYIEMGKKLLLFGSSSVYKKFIFFREISTNPLAEKSKFYNQADFSIFMIAEILKEIRKESSLNSRDNLSGLQTISILYKDIGTNPFNDTHYHRLRHNYLMLQFEFILFKIITLTYLKTILYILKPIIDIPILLINYFFLVPCGKVLLYPSN